MFTTRHRRMAAFAVAVALTGAGPALASPVVMSSVPQVSDRTFQAEILAAHNAERRAVGVPDLVWSDALAAEAEAWANGLAASGAMTHAAQRTHGENLYMNAVGRRTATQMVAGWLAERANYIPGAAHPNVSKTGNWADVGHYTAMVWSTTTEVGCAVARGKVYDFLVCRYNPPGNVRGRAAYDASKPRREVVVAAAPSPTPAPVVAAAPVPSPLTSPTPPPVQTARATDPVPAPAPAKTPAAQPSAPPAAVVPVKVPQVDEANPVPVPSAKPTVVARQAD